MKKHDFTLIELMIVLAILMILLCLLLPALNKANARAIQNSCTGNQKQIMQAVMLYCSDFDDRTPPLNLAESFSGSNPSRSRNWWSNLLIRSKYLPEPKVWISEIEGKSGSGVLVCPASGTENRTIGIYASVTYGVGYQVSLLLSRIQDASSRVLIGDTRGSISFYSPKTTPWTDTLPQSFDPRHTGGSVAGFLDGHIEYRPYSAWLAAKRRCFGPQD